VSAGARTPRDDLAERTAHGEVYLRRLVRAQLALSLQALLAFGGIVGALPVVLAAVPGLQAATVLGVPVPFALIGAPLLVAFVALARLYERRAEALEEAFRELVERE
jgi:uncharacterized membrane protein